MKNGWECYKSRDLTTHIRQSSLTILSICAFEEKSINGIGKILDLANKLLHKFAFTKSSNKIDPRIFLYIMYKLAACPSNTFARSYQIAPSEIYVAISFLRIFSYSHKATVSLSNIVK